MSGLSDAIDGLVARLETGIPGLRVYDHPPDSINSFPAAIVLAQDIDYLLAFGGNSFEFNVDVWLLVSSGDDNVAFSRIYDHMDPTETNLSVRAAIKGDRTLGGNVDDSQVVAVRNVGRAEEMGGWYAGARFIVQITKKVA